ncbi:2-hydroxyacid dehydrogenase [Pseudalkalibacillus sp. A8]|uniref:2-hydroxyacid dehydrogenase n=1 Tax=Pseudalkalibacillus sp. A8 TaxID=3382641 RepID=UPI0038B52965
MKLLAISDLFIPKDMMQEGLSSLTSLGVDIEVREWKHDSLEMLQKDNLAVELQGPDAVPVPEELFSGIETCDLLIVQFVPVNQAIIEKAERLKLIGVLRGGRENIDPAAAESRGIEVINTPGRNARAVAEFTLGLILSEIRNIARSHAALKNGEWRKSFPNSEAIPELNEKTVGIVGFGNVGNLLAGYLKALGCNILVYDEYTSVVPEPYRRVDKNTLLEQSDVVSLHLRLSEKTYHFIDADALRKMKPSAILVNTARSGLIDEKALVDCLKNNQVIGAALDVFDVEPLTKSQEIVELDNLTITPHIAGSTIDAFRNSPRQIARYLMEKLKLY